MFHKNVSEKKIFTVNEKPIRIFFLQKCALDNMYIRIKKKCIYVIQCHTLACMQCCHTFIYINIYIAWAIL